MSLKQKHGCVDHNIISCGCDDPSCFGCTDCTWNSISIRYPATVDLQLREMYEAPPMCDTVYNDPIEFKQDGSTSHLRFIQLMTVAKHFYQFAVADGPCVDYFVDKLTREVMALTLPEAVLNLPLPCTLIDVIWEYVIDLIFTRVKFSELQTALIPIEEITISRITCGYDNVVKNCRPYGAMEIIHLNMHSDDQFFIARCNCGLFFDVRLPGHANLDHRESSRTNFFCIDCMKYDFKLFGECSNRMLKYVKYVPISEYYTALELQHPLYRILYTC